MIKSVEEADRELERRLMPGLEKVKKMIANMRPSRIVDCGICGGGGHTCMWSGSLLPGRTRSHIAECPGCGGTGKVLEFVRKAEEEEEKESEEA